MNMSKIAKRIVAATLVVATVGSGAGMASAEGAGGTGSESGTTTTQVERADRREDRREERAGRREDRQGQREKLRAWLEARKQITEERAAAVREARTTLVETLRGTKDKAARVEAKEAFQKAVASANEAHKAAIAELGPRPTLTK